MPKKKKKKRINFFISLSSLFIIVESLDRTNDVPGILSSQPLGILLIHFFSTLSKKKKKKRINFFSLSSLLLL